ncbi:zinc finger MYND domain-containing protein 10-like isoform X2 [Stegodyphus dumicola]|uniref:zinc finger MYND domain-containing protein 10-like isoform X2 n=1 Tax=Stegodyphus dumicola TaxID=202533 RepID=UPI0015A9DB87|nr:zinc finger MYND domain-containing protein 10-like isoform X2 [Stegodyphus dumicola]
MYKLSVQALLDVKSSGEEVVKEYLVTLQRVPLLIHELIVTETWRLKVLPLILKKEIKTTAVIPMYMVLYHEITIVSLLEAILFHEEMIESAEDSLIDLVDYSYRRIILLKSIEFEDDQKDSLSLSERNYFLKQKKDIDFESGIKCVSILSYMAQHQKIIPLSILHRLLTVHDIPLLFSSLIYEPPWIRGKAKKEKYDDGKWIALKPEKFMKISKAEGQVWICLMQLLLGQDCQRKYDISDFRKEQFLKLRSRINEHYIDQMPILNELLRFLEHLSLFDAPLPKTSIVIEQVPEIRESIFQKNKRKWEDIAVKQIEEYFSLSETDLRELCKKLSGSFDLKYLEAMCPDTSACASSVNTT